MSETIWDNWRPWYNNIGKKRIDFYFPDMIFFFTIWSAIVLDHRGFLQYILTRSAIFVFSYTAFLPYLYDSLCIFTLLLKRRINIYIIIFRKYYFRISLLGLSLSLLWIIPPVWWLFLNFSQILSETSMAECNFNKAYKQTCQTVAPRYRCFSVSFEFPSGF